MNPPPPAGRDPESGTRRSVVLDLVSEVQVLGLASAAAVAERYVGNVDRQAGRRRAGHPLRRGAGPHDGDVERLALPPARPGGRTAASLWVHNSSAAPVEVTLRAGGLFCADGAVVPADAVAVEPRGPVLVSPGGSVEHRVEVLLPGSTAPGHYHGVVTSTATPQQALPVHVEVLPQETWS